VYRVWGLNNWRWALGASLPVVGINATGVAQHIYTFDWPAGVINVHPYPSRLGIVGWRAPTSGTVAITGTVRDMDSACGDGLLGTSTMAGPSWRQAQ